jgi:4-alpha-glucanotransferase
VGDWVVTPRIGKPVEINALWHNALCVMSEFAVTLGETDSYATPAAVTRAGFGRFVRDDGLGLHDVIDGPDGTDDRIRPNQIFAVSLPHSPLSTSDQAGVIEVCRRHRTGCVRSHPAAPIIIRVTAVACESVTAAITRAQSGAGCWDILPWRCLA